MSASTPADLAVTFRSLARRQREAIGDADPAPRPVSSPSCRATSPRPPPPCTPRRRRSRRPGHRGRPADEWDEATLDTLRAEGLAAGAVLRRIPAAAEEDDD